MLEQLNQLLAQDKTKKEQYDLFILFAKGRGAEFLKTKLVSLAMEESPYPTKVATTIPNYSRRKKKKLR